MRKYANGSLRMSLLSVIAATALAVEAAGPQYRFYWTGAGGDGQWRNEANWKGASGTWTTVPGWSDTVVFTNSEPLTLRFDAVGSVELQWPRCYRFEGAADVTLAGGINFHWRDSAVNPEILPSIYIEAGIEVVTSNNVSTWDNAMLEKLGGGTFRQVGRTDNTSMTLSDSSDGLDLQEGTWITEPVEGNLYGSYMRGKEVRISPGATFVNRGYNTLSSATAWQVDGTLELAGSSTRIGCLAGTGTVRRAEGTTDARLLFYPGKINPQTFSGDFSGITSIEIVRSDGVEDVDFVFPVVRSDLLSDVGTVSGELDALKFGEGIGKAVFKALDFSKVTSFRLEDVSGGPVDVHADSFVGVSNMCFTGGGNVVLGKFKGKAGGKVEIDAGVFCKTPAVSAYCGLYTSSRRPVPLTLNGGPFDLSVSGGRLWLDNYEVDGTDFGSVSSVDVTGGELVLRRFMCSAAASEADPDVLTLDGGMLGFSTYDTEYKVQLPDAGSLGKVALFVGAAGGTIRAHGNGYITHSELVLATPVRAAAEGADGGLKVYPRMSDMTYAKPVLLAGGFEQEGGRILLKDSGEIAATPSFLGTGDVTLRDLQLDLQGDATASPTLRLATSSGKTFTYGGVVSLALRGADGTQQPVSVEIGSLVREGAGAGLIVCESDATDLGSGSSRVKVAGGMPAYANGLVKAPVVLDLKSTCRLAAYDAENGFKAFTDEKTLANAGESDVVVEGATLAAGAVKRILALRLAEWKTLTLNAGSALQVGGGESPAMVLVDNATVTGEGTLEFMSSEGIIVLGDHPYGSKVNARLSGAADVSYLARPAFKRFVTVGGANTYTGVTRIRVACVKPTNALAFSTGDVYVLGGERNGGKIQFNEPLTFANAFHVNGWGHPLDQWSQGSGGYGALSFCTNDVVLAGPVEILGQARICAEDEGDRGILSGTVSGGTLTVYGGAGVVRLAGENVHTGGTEVVQATLELVRGTSAGTGRVLLDGGILRFVNTEPVTFTNDVGGVGTIVVAGSAPVTFSGASFDALPFKTFAAGTVIDTANAANNVYVPHLASDMDLNGKTLSLGGISGSGKVSNGKLVIAGEIRPGGRNAIGTLAFAEGVLTTLAGATYACDLIGGETDCISIEGDIDLSGLNLDVVATGKVEPGTSLVVSCTGSLSGLFSATALPKPWMSVEYDERSVLLDYNRPGLTIVVK